MAKNRNRSKSKEDFKDEERTSRNTRGSRRNTSSGNTYRGKGKEDKVKSTNDPAWYSTNAELLRDAASIPFSWPTGTDLDNTNKIYQDVVPGVCCLELKPTIGTSNSMNSPINVASNAIYSFVRHANSGHSNYDAPDLMMYLLAMSHVYSFVTWCQRLLGMVNMYDQRNRYLPYALVTANWVDYDNLRDHIADFRYWLNNFITKVASLAVPATMPVFNRLAMLFSNVYIDGPTVKDQLYMYVPAMYYKPWMKFSLDSDQAGQLEWMDFTIANSYATVAEIEKYGTDLFNAIWDQEDFGIMSGDILKAYGDNIVKLSPVPVDFQIAPIYDTMVLHQMKNAKPCNAFDISKITQFNGRISQLVLIDSTISVSLQRMAKDYSLLNKVLSSDFDSPTPEVVIESTRLMYGMDPSSFYVYCGTELCTRVQVWQYSNSGQLGHRNLVWSDFSLYYTGSRNDLTDVAFLTTVQRVGYLKAFKYMPEFIFLTMDSSGNLINSCCRVWDVDNYAVLSQGDIIKMHEAALMSLFAVPAIAKIS